MFEDLHLRLFVEPPENINLFILYNFSGFCSHQFTFWWRVNPPRVDQCMCCAALSYRWITCWRQSVLLKHYVVNYLWNSPHTQKKWLLLDFKTLHWYFLVGMHWFLEAMDFSVSGLIPEPVTYWWISIWSGSRAQTWYLKFRDFIDTSWFEDIDLRQQLCILQLVIGVWSTPRSLALTV